MARMTNKSTITKALKIMAELNKNADISDEMNIGCIAQMIADAIDNRDVNLSLNERFNKQDYANKQLARVVRSYGY